MTPDPITQIIDAVERGEEYSILRDGKAVAVLIPASRYDGLVDDLEALSADAVLPTEEST